jgi:cell division septation protein DedD
LMTSMLNLEAGALPEVESRAVETREAAGQDPAQQSISATSATNDYEIVLGRAQIASWLFVGVVAVAICSSLAYLAAEKITAQKIAVISKPIAPPAPVPPPVAASTALPEASILLPPKADVAALAKNPKTAAPLFAEPELGKVYIQVAAIERGMAMLFTEGLRSHGFDSFVAPGPNDKIFRVLIGPLPDPASFRQAMVTVNAMDLANFARKYEK